MNITITKLLLILSFILSSSIVMAATVTTYTDLATYDVALTTIPHTATLENFSSVQTNYLMSDTGIGDSWDGFNVIRTGTSRYGSSGYCPALNAPYPASPTRCVGYNTSAPNLPGITGAFSTTTPAASVNFTPTNPIFSFHFDFVDWNDISVRSQFLLNFSDGTNLVVTGPVNPSSAPAQFFGFIIDQAFIDQGVTIENIIWVPVTSELVGFWNIGTKTYIHTQPVPTLSEWMLILLALSLLMIGLRNSNSIKTNNF